MNDNHSSATSSASVSSSAQAVVLAILALPGRLRALVGWILAAAAAAAVPLPVQIAAVAGGALAALQLRL